MHTTRHQRGKSIEHYFKNLGIKPLKRHPLVSSFNHLKSIGDERTFLGHQRNSSDILGEIFDMH